MTGWRAVAEAVQRCGWDPSTPGLASVGFMRAVALELERRGWRLLWEVPIDPSGDGPRIDLVAHLELERVAIEFDRAQPRISSLEKLRAFDACTARVVALREGYARLVFPRGGLDAIVTFRPPRLYTSEQPFGYAPRSKVRKGHR